MIQDVPALITARHANFLMANATFQDSIGSLTGRNF
jgi:hypothetical protein